MGSSQGHDWITLASHFFSIVFFLHFLAFFSVFIILRKLYSSLFLLGSHRFPVEFLYYISYASFLVSLLVKGINAWNSQEKNRQAVSLLFAFLSFIIKPH